jgi:hypothetical protein
MSFAAEQIAIENYFATGFTACAVKYENVEFVPVQETSFAELKIVDFSSHQAEISGLSTALHRSTGLIIISIHTSQGTGTQAARLLADKAATVFRRKQFSGITTRSPVVRNAGEVEEWYVVRVLCSYYRDAIY